MKYMLKWKGYDNSFKMSYKTGSHANKNKTEV